MKPHGMTGKRNAAKDDRASDNIHFRCRPEDKVAWSVDAEASGMKLSEWIVKKLNA